MRALQGKAGRKKGQRGRVAYVVLSQPVAESPNDAVPRAEREPMLKINIVSVEILPKCVRNIPMRPVVIQLEFEIGVF